MDQVSDWHRLRGKSRWERRAGSLASLLQIVSDRHTGLGVERSARPAALPAI
jgi:hypothetical protein